MRPISEATKPPRTYFLRYPFGHALGEKNNHKQQEQIVKDALDLLNTITQPGTIVDSPYQWRRHQFK